jgi:small-conductance mechanosensitive channel
LLVLRILGFGGIASGLLAGAGVSAIVLGFAFKEIGENFLAGVILAFNRPFDVEDTVEIDGVFGKVKTLQFRYTHIKTFDGKDVYIPNADVVTNPVINYTADGFIRFDFMVGIAYEDRIEDAKQLILRTIAANAYVVNDPVHQTFVVEDELGVSTMNLKVFFWVETLDYRKGARETRGDVIREVKEALEQHGFYLPADIQEIKLYGNADPLDLNVRLGEGVGLKQTKER